MKVNNDHMTSSRLVVLAVFTSASCLCAIPATAQSDCDTEDLIIPDQSGLGDCSDYWNYVPHDPRYFPIKRVRVMMHVFQYSATDPRNFVPGDEHFLTQVIDKANEAFAALSPMAPNPYNSEYVLDSRIRLDFDEGDVRYYVAPVEWEEIDYALINTVGQNWVFDNPALSAEEKAGFLHFLVKGGTGECRIGGAAPQPGNFIRLGSWWCQFLGPSADDVQAQIAEAGANVRHEVAHSISAIPCILLLRWLS